MVAPLHSPPTRVVNCCSLNLGTEEVQNQICFECLQVRIPVQIKHKNPHQNNTLSSGHQLCDKTSTKPHIFSIVNAIYGVFGFSFLN